MNERHSGDHAHGLAEIIGGRPMTTQERVKTAVAQAPFWVIAVTAHVAVAGLLALLYFRQDVKTASDEGLILTQASAPLDRIEEVKAPAKTEAVVPLPIPNDQAIVDADEMVDATQDFNIWGAVDAPRGIADGQADSTSDLLTTSFGGKGLAGAMGLGSGSAPGGGARLGRPDGGNARLKRIKATGHLRPKDPKTIDEALRWLRAHQSPDGSWDCDGYSANCDASKGAACSGRGSAVFDAGVTGLALLAFLGAGVDGRGTEPADECVRKGLKWLRENQDAEGCFGSQSDVRFTYAHACATIAMCEAAAYNKSPVWKRSAQLGLDFIGKCQNPYKAWRYGMKPGDNDVSVTGWMLMALKAGKDAGLSVNDRTMKDGLAYIDSVTDEDTGRCGYTKKGELPVRPEGLGAKWPATESESLTAVALCSRIFCGSAEGHPMTKAAVELISKKLPVWNEAAGTIDMYYWYYATLAMFQIGGEAFARWNKNLETVITANQIKDGCARGSFDPKDPWSDEGGRVYSTALMVLCYEVYWRYPQVFGAKGAGRK